MLRTGPAAWRARSSVMERSALAMGDAEGDADESLDGGAAHGSGHGAIDTSEADGD